MQFGNLRHPLLVISLFFSLTSYADVQLDCVTMNRVTPVGITTPCRYSSFIAPPWNVSISTTSAPMNSVPIIELTDHGFFSNTQEVVVPEYLSPYIDSQAEKINNAVFDLLVFNDLIPPVLPVGYQPSTQQTALDVLDYVKNVLSIPVVPVAMGPDKHYAEYNSAANSINYNSDIIDLAAPAFNGYLVAGVIGHEVSHADSAMRGIMQFDFQGTLTDSALSASGYSGTVHGDEIVAFVSEIPILTSLNLNAALEAVNTNTAMPLDSMLATAEETSNQILSFRSAMQELVTNLGTNGVNNSEIAAQLANQGNYIWPDATSISFVQKDNATYLSLTDPTSIEFAAIKLEGSFTSNSEALSAFQAKISEIQAYLSDLSDPNSPTSLPALSDQFGKSLDLAKRVSSEITTNTHLNQSVIDSISGVPSTNFTDAMAQAAQVAIEVEESLLSPKIPVPPQVQPPLNCTFNGGTILDGQSILAYKVSSIWMNIGCGAVSEARKCNNGVLSGTATYSSCTTRAW